MKTLQEYLNNPVEENALRRIFADNVQYKPGVPSHKRLYLSFINWFKDMSELYDEDLIFNMLNSAQEDIRLGQI